MWKMLEWTTTTKMELFKYISSKKGKDKIFQQTCFDIFKMGYMYFFVVLKLNLNAL